MRAMEKTWVRLLMVLSGGALTVLLMMPDSKLSFAVTGALALGLTGVLVFRKNLLEKLFEPRPWYLWLLAAILCLSQLYPENCTFYY